MRGSIALSLLSVLAFVGGTAPAAALCKQDCQKHCMGNDTPKERADCLKRDKCESQPLCPTGGTGAGSGSKLDPGGPRPKNKIPVPKVDPGGVKSQSAPRVE
jgi:hypothetical protein